jgi:hypothetical protein
MTLPRLDWVENENDEVWFENASVEAYLRGDTWIVLFWEEGVSVKDPRAPVNRFDVLIAAVSGQVRSAGR